MTAAELIAQFEGYASKAYWDVNAWRLGYGSDTEGPAQFRVTKDMTTTRDRALQNLALRVPEFATIAARGVGSATWARLTEDQRSALTSIAYNYGRMPIRVDPADPEGTAARIRALGSHNAGVNRKRRNKEATFYLTGSLTGKPSTAVVVAGAAAGASGATAGQQAGAGNMEAAIIATALMIFFGIVAAAFHAWPRTETPAPSTPSPLDAALADLEEKQAALDMAKKRVRECAPQLEDAISALQAQLTFINSMEPKT